MKKTKIVALLLLLCLGLIMLIGCGGTGGGETPPCEIHVDNDNNGECDNCDEIVCAEHTDVNKDFICDVCRNEIERVNVTFTITLVDDRGEAVPNVELTLNQYGEVKATYTTNAQGKINGEVSEAGKYTVIFTELPENWYSNSNYSEITINSSSNSFEFIALDNTPNGSVERPFPSENAETGEAASVVFPAGATYNFTTKGAARYIVVNNANAKLIYKDKEHLPNDEGVIRVLFEATEVTSATIFQIVNTADTDNEISLSFEAIKGTQANPYDAVEGEDYTVNVEPDTSVYYKYVATSDGILMVKSPSSVNSIMLYNTTSYVVTSYTNGAGVNYIPVKTGDKVDITVTLVKDAEASEVEFALTLFAGTEQDPIVISESTAIRVGKGTTYHFNIEIENASVAISSNVAICVNGGEPSTTASVSGTAFVIENSTDENADVTITITAE